MGRWLVLMHALLPFLLVVLTNFADAKSIVVGDDLDDVVDNEEDDEWKNWAPKSRYDDPTKKAAAFAMIKLVFKENRDIEEVRDIADRWTKKLQTGAATVGFKPIDPNTLFINVRQDDELENVKRFVLDQDETYEIMIDGRTFRRNPDDPAVEVAGESIERDARRRLKRERMLKAKMERDSRQYERRAEREKAMREAREAARQKAREVARQEAWEAARRRRQEAEL